MYMTSLVYSGAVYIYSLSTARKAQKAVCNY